MRNSLLSLQKTSTHQPNTEAKFQHSRRWALCFRKCKMGFVGEYHLRKQSPYEKNNELVILNQYHNVE